MEDVESDQSEEQIQTGYNGKNFNISKDDKRKERQRNYFNDVEKILNNVISEYIQP